MNLMNEHRQVVTQHLVEGMFNQISLVLADYLVLRTELTETAIALKKTRSRLRSLAYLIRREGATVRLPWE